jgi:hypothetical protein
VAVDGGVVAVIIGVVVVGALAQNWRDDRKLRALERAYGSDNGITPELRFRHGELREQLVCPHCQVQGRVLTKPVTKKAGIDGAKATGAVLTGGVSVVLTGLSRMETVTEAHCANCSSTWHY